MITTIIITDDDDSVSLFNASNSRVERVVRSEITIGDEALLSGDHLGTGLVSEILGEAHGLDIGEWTNNYSDVLASISNSIGRNGESILPIDLGEFAVFTSCHGLGESLSLESVIRESTLNALKSVDE